MKAFLIKQKNGDFRDAAVRASNEAEAKELAGDGELCEIRDDVATAIGVPDTPGLHDGAISKWAPTFPFGEAKR
jgi:hypothetical protein